MAEWVNIEFDPGGAGTGPGGGVATESGTGGECCCGSGSGGVFCILGQQFCCCVSNVRFYYGPEATLFDPGNLFYEYDPLECHTLTLADTGGGNIQGTIQFDNRPITSPAGPVSVTSGGVLIACRTNDTLLQAYYAANFSTWANPQVEVLVANPADLFGTYSVETEAVGPFGSFYGLRYDLTISGGPCST